MDRPGKNTRKPMLKKKKRRLIVVFLLAALTITGFLSYYIFQVTTVEINGLISLSKEDVMESSGIELGQNIFSVNLEEVRSAVSQNPLLEVVSIYRVLPDKIVINLEERKMKLALPYGNEYVLIDTQGTAISFTTDTTNCIIIEGISPSGVSPGSKITALDTYLLFVLRNVVTSFETTPIATEIQTIDLTIPTLVSMKLKSGLTIRVGTVSEDTIEEKAGWVTKLYPQLVNEGKRYGTLDISGDRGASYIPPEQ